jgi:threonine dehydrogenase-like Zn-dependent dehydrogenase
MELTAGVGVDAALECVGTDQAIQTAAEITRPGGMIGAVGLPTYEDFSYSAIFWKNVGIRGGAAPARAYIPQLMKAVLNETINPGLVFDLRVGLDKIKDAYAAMDERRAIKSLVLIGNT